MEFTFQPDFNYSCGVDLHSASFNVYIIDLKGRKIQSGKLSTVESEIRKFFDVYRSMGLKAAVEIGTLTFWFCAILDSMGIANHVVNTLENSLISKSRKKTDKIDAKTLSFQLLKGILPEAVYKPSLCQRELRQMVSQRGQFVRSRSQTINRVHSLLKNHGITRSKGDMRSSKYRKQLIGELKDMGNSFNHRLKTYLDTINSLSTAIKDLEAEMYGHIKRYSFKDYRRLITIPGVGLITACAIIALVGDWSRFKNARKLASYLGIAPGVAISSDKTVGSNAITKQGNSLMRGYLIQSAIGVLRCKSEDAQSIKEWHKTMKKNIGWKKARVSLGRKLCCIMFGMMKNGTDYDPSLITKNSKPASD